MSRMHSKYGGSRMRKEYGECSEYVTCAECCNYQLKCRCSATLVCIAYDSQSAWNSRERACGLFNIPFRGLRPKRSELIQVIQTNKQTEPVADQKSMFADS